MDIHFLYIMDGSLALLFSLIFKNGDISCFSLFFYLGNRRGDQGSIKRDQSSLVLFGHRLSDLWYLSS